MRPFSAGTFLISRPETSANDSGTVEDALDPRAVQIVDRDQMPVHATLLCVGGGADRDLVAAVDLLDVHVDALIAGGRQVLADVVGPDRKFAMAAVDQHGQLDTGGAAVIEQHVDRGAGGAARVEDVIDDHDRAAVDREVELRRVHDRARAAASSKPQVVAVEADVDRAEADLGIDQFAGQRGSRAPSTAPRRCMPTIAKRGESPGCCGGFFSTISWAIRTSVRRMSSRSSATV